MRNSGRDVVIDDAFKALADPIRRSILETLGKKEFFCAVNGETVDGICVQDLSSILQLPQSTISRHLTILRRAGLVGHQQKGVWHYYFCDQGGFDAVLGWLNTTQSGISQDTPPHLPVDNNLQKSSHSVGVKRQQERSDAGI